jgi:hypothetical protein
LFSWKDDNKTRSLIQTTFSADETIMIVNYFFTDGQSYPGPLVTVAMQALKYAEYLILKMILEANAVIFNRNGNVIPRIDIPLFDFLIIDPVWRDGDAHLTLIIKL